MFDVFRFARDVDAKAKTYKAKVCGATMPLVGLPDVMTVAGVAALAKEQTANVTVTLPKQTFGPDVSGQGKLEGISPADASKLVLQQYPSKASEEDEGEEKTPKPRKETKADRKKREAAEAEAAKLAEELKARGENHVSNGQGVQS